MLKFNALTPFIGALFVLFVQPAAAQQSQIFSDQLPVFKTVPGLASLPVTNVKKAAALTTAQVTLRGKPLLVMSFRVKGVTLGAVIPKSFKLTDIIPVPSRTPLDGVSFTNIAFIYLPMGATRQNDKS